MTQNNVGIYASQISGHLYGGPYGAYDSLATVTLSAATNPVTFAGIPSGYKHLQLRSLVKDTSTSTGASGIAIRFNSDSSSSYTYHYLNGDGSIASATAGTSQTYANANGASVLSGSNTYTYAASIIDILDYSNVNKYKTVRTLAGVDLNGSGTICLSSDLWMNTSAISSITIYAFSTSFAIGSQFALYGVK